MSLSSGVATTYRNSGESADEAWRMMHDRGIEELIPATLRVAEELRRLSRAIRPPVEADGRVRDPATERAQLARIIVHHRQLRMEMMPMLSDDLGWALALSVYLAAHEERPSTVAALATATQASVGAVERRVGALVTDGVFLRVPARRGRAVVLAPDAARDMNAYFDSVLTMLL